MRTSQWFILCMAFWALCLIFILIDLTWGNACVLTTMMAEPLTGQEIVCINTEIYDPFIWTFAVLGFACLVNAGLEWHGKGKR